MVQILYDYDLLISGTGHLIFHALSKAAKKNNTKVILTGSGGDEISGGYYWQKKAHKIPNTFFYSKKNTFFFTLDNFIKNLFFKKNKFLRKLYKLYQLFFKPSLYHMESHSLNLSFFMKDTYLKVEKKMEKLYDNYVNISDNVFCEKNFYNNFEYRNIFMTIANQNHFFDISTMSSSIENRAPLLDYRLVEYMKSISKIKKNKNGIKSLYKKIVRNILPDYCRGKKVVNTTNCPLFEDKNFKNQMIKYIKDNILYIKRLFFGILKDEINSTDNNFNQI